MVTAYVMVKASTGEVDRLKGEMLDVHDGIETVSIVAGDVDFVVTTGVDSTADVKEIAASIQEIDGIEDTRTYIAMD